MAFWCPAHSGLSSSRLSTIRMTEVRDRPNEWAIAAVVYPAADSVDLAYWTGLAGDAAGARDQYAALLPIIERVQGPGHPHTLATRHELACWTGEAGMRPGLAIGSLP
jgi:hypothetical protein